MSQASHKISADDSSWDIAVRRERILRVALEKKRLSADDVLNACKQLGIGTAYFYRLLRAYKIDQRASALLRQKSGPPKGSSRLSRQVDDVIAVAVQTYYLSKQKLRVSKLQQIIALECHDWVCPDPREKPSISALEQSMPERF